MVYAAFLALPLPLLLAAGALAGIIIALWTVRFPKWAVVTLVVSLVAGQLVRLPLPGQGGGLLPSDVAVVLTVCAAIFHSFFSHRAGTRNHSIFQILASIFLFILWSLFTLTVHIPELGLSNSLIAVLYWLRLSATLLLLPAFLILFRNLSLRVFTQKSFLIGVTALVLAGLFQFVFFPNLNLPGWDPHQGRVVSTWLDPNFFGGFLIIVLPWLAAISFQQKKNSRLLFTIYCLLLGAALIALLFTQSRSSFLALGLSLLLLSPLIIWQLRRLRPLPRQGLVASLLVATVTLCALIVTLFPERLVGIFTVDDTAALRVSSFTSTWQRLQDHPWLGVGAGAYQFSADGGSNPDFTIHSRAGSDNSLVTVWVTTGLIGVLSFFAIWAVAAGHVLVRAAHGSLPALAGAISLLALFIHSQFVNSFLYSHLLITLILIIALVWNPSTANSSS